MAIDSFVTTSGAIRSPYSPLSATVARAAIITMQPSADPESRVRGWRTRVERSSDQVT
jgi:hypothetical protein